MITGPIFWTRLRVSLRSFRARFRFIVSIAILASVGGCAAREFDQPIIEVIETDLRQPLSKRESIRIATINMWGVVALGFDWAEHIDERFAALRDRMRINADHIDVLLIQEAWKDSARRDLLTDPKVRAQFPYLVDAVEKPGGSGLAILSRHPINEARFLRFEDQGNCWRFWEGDCLGGKGVLATRIEFGDRLTWVSTTHLIACYTPELEPETACDQSDGNSGTRAAQVKELRSFLETLSEPALLPVLVGGDFNFTRTSRYYVAMSTSSHPQGAVWTEAHGNQIEPNRIDFIWARAGERTHWRAVIPTHPFLTEGVELPSGEIVPLSDHPALVAEFCPVRTPDEDPLGDCR